MTQTRSISCIGSCCVIRTECRCCSRGRTAAQCWKHASAQGNRVGRSIQLEGSYSVSIQEWYIRSVTCKIQSQTLNSVSAVCFCSKRYTADAAKEALQDMPPRNEEDLDAVTLHNQALLHMDSEPTDGFKKLNFLLSQPPFPTETFGTVSLLLQHRMCAGCAHMVVCFCFLQGICYCCISSMDILIWLLTCSPTMPICTRHV